LADDRPATVWFTAKAAGVSAGKSGKVLSFGKPAEGDFIEVRPTGSKDALFFSAAELTLTRPKRQPAPPKPVTVPAPSAPVDSPEPEAEPVEIYQPAPVQKRAPAKRATKPPAEVTVTLNSTPWGEWTVEVMVGSKRRVRSLPVPAVAVAKAAKELPGEVEEAISAVLAAARQQHEDKVARLQAELAAAQRALKELS
jgi:hypothetical protein